MDVKMSPWTACRLRLRADQTYLGRLREYLLPLFAFDISNQECAADTLVHFYELKAIRGNGLSR